MNIATLPATEEAKKNFYPTPPELAERMFAKVKWSGVKNILEPSAGKGDLITAFSNAYGDYEYRSSKINVDAIEIDPHLRAILKYEWMGGKLDEIYESWNSLRDKEYTGTTQEKAEYRKVKKQKDNIERLNVRIVHDDFLTYSPWRQYDACIMNPPFSKGEKHIMKALDIMQDGGQVVCLLNAETLLNPYTNGRKALVEKLEELDADIEYVNSAFTGAERGANVDIAIVYVNIPEVEYESEIFTRMEREVEADVEADPELQELITKDYLEAAIQRYNVDRKATTEFYKQCKGFQRRVKNSLTEENPEPVISVRISGSNRDFTLDNCIRVLNRKYWKALMTNPQFTGMLTSKLRDRYTQEVDKMTDYPFTKFNIDQIRSEMSHAMSEGIEEEVLALFDKMTVEYAHWEECKTTVHLYNGWKTNKAHKIGKKVILPTYCYNSFDIKWGEFGFDARKAYGLISDIEKAMDYLCANPLTETYNLWDILNQVAHTHKARNVEFKYFLCDFYKKGTVHFKFRPEAMEVVDRLNIFGGQHHGWLPPCYGKASYKDMDQESRSVVDSFHGNGTEGSGAADYAEVMRRADYYLATPVKSLPALTA